MMKKFCWFLFMMLLISVPGRGQGYYFDHFNIAQGLSNNAVICSVQDKNGFLWFGTKDGLNRFDGYTFKKYFSNVDAKNGLASNYITCLLVDDQNILWVGTDNGLYRFHADTEHFEVVPETASKEIIEMAQDASHQIWFIAGYKLFRGEKQENALKTQAVLTDLRLGALAKDHSGSIWTIANRALINLKSLEKIPLAVPAHLPFHVEAITFDADGFLWIGTQHQGLYKVNIPKAEITHVLPYLKQGQNLFIRDIKKYNSSQLWVASESGLLLIDPHTHQWKVFNYERDNPWSLSDNAIYSITKDHQGGVWIGSYFGGINYFHQKHNLFERTFPRSDLHSISGNAVREIRKDNQGNLWVGTEDNGLNFWNLKTNKFEHFSTKTGLAHNNIHGLEVVGDSLLVGTFNNGLDILSIRSKKIIAHFNRDNTNGALGDNFVVHTYKTKNGRIFFTTTSGLYQFTPGSNTFSKVRIVPDSIFYTSIFEDNQERIWLTTWRDGMYVIDPSMKSSHAYQHDIHNPESINSNRTNRIHQDSEGNIWIATENGLNIWTQDAKPLKSFTKADGLPSNLILSMTEDANKNMWLSSTYGLIKIGVKDFKISTYNKEFGLSDLQFNYNSMLKDSLGFIYFGSTNGLIKFHPDSLLKNRQVEQNVPIYFTFARSSKRDLSLEPHFKAHDYTHASYDKLILDYDESTLQIDFAALNYVDAASTSYYYKLKGFYNDWILSKQNKAYFTKLPPGHYTLVVKAVDSEGKSISQEIEIDIQVNKPFWASNWAFVLYTLFLGTILFFTYRYFDNQIKERNRRRLIEINAKRERKFYQAKLDFFTQVAHDIKTPLTLIKGPLEKLVDRQSLSEERAARLLTTMHKNTDKLVRLTNSILDFHKIEMGDNRLDMKAINLSDFVNEFILDYQPSFNLEQINLTYQIQPDVVGLIDEDKLAKILENLFSNAFKYAEKKVDIHFFVDQSLNYWFFEIKNDGHVLHKREIDQLFKPFHRSQMHSHIEGSGIGLALSRSFALLHGGDLRYVESSENLNIFVLTFPLNKA